MMTWKFCSLVKWRKSTDKCSVYYKSSIEILPLDLALNLPLCQNVVIISFYLFVCLLNSPSVSSPVPKSIEPPTKGKPAPTKSSILADQRNGKQKSIPKIPANIVIIAVALITVLIDFPVIFFYLNIKSFH